MKATTSLPVNSLLLPAIFLLASMPAGRADVQLPAIFADHMVLQRDKKVTIWGTAEAGEGVTVSFGGEDKTAVADGAGKWQVWLDPMEASSTGKTLTVSGKNTLAINDVLVGEVWLCSGQSNMEWALARCIGGPEAVAKSANSNLRLCTIPHNSQMAPQEDAPAKWAISGPNSTRFFSAIAWWFGSKLQKELGVPVGIINDSFGGTTIQSWMPAETLRNGPWPQDGSTDVSIAKAAYEKRKAAFQPTMDKYFADKAAAIQTKASPPPFPVGSPGDFRGPSVLWNGMVAPILKFSVRGVAWYQGESNAYVRAADSYAALLPALIADWRGGFGERDLPFIIFQIAPNRKPQADPNEQSGIAQVREAELKTVLKTPHTALVVTMDLGEPNVHYLNKEPAADRALQAALGLAYGKNVSSSGPIFDSIGIDGSNAVLQFTHTGGGLVAKGGAPAGLAVAGEDRKFFFADAKIDGDRVIVSSPQVAKPVAVRYGWADLPKVNLFGKDGLPASSFRTDDWPLP